MRPRLDVLAHLSAAHVRGLDERAAFLLALPSATGGGEVAADGWAEDGDGDDAAPAPASFFAQANCQVCCRVRFIVFFGNAARG